MRTVQLGCVAMIGLAVSVAVSAADWPVWRGEKGNGISSESAWNPKAINALTIKWSIDLGRGYSAVSTQGGRAYTMGNKQDNDTIYCLDTANGKVIWTHSYSCKQGSYKGPRATPVVVDGSVYTLSREGLALCLDAEKGTVTWSKNLIDEFNITNLKWGLSSTPVIAMGAVMYNAGESGIALDAATGAKLWGSGGKGSYAVPVVYKKTVIMFSKESAIAVDIKTGKKVWSYPWKTKYDVNAADPVVLGDKLLLTSGYGKGAVMLDLSSGKPKKVWQNNALKAHFGTPVYLNGVIFGVDGQAGRGNVVCMGLDGSIKWSEKTGFASLMAADNKLIILTDKGKLIIADASKKAFTPIAAVDTGLGKTCWTQPILSNGIIYCRNDKGKLLAIDVSK